MPKKRNIGGVVIDLKLNDTDFANGIKSAQIRLAKFEVFSKRAFVNVGKAAAVALAGVGVAATGVFVAGISKAIEEVDQLGKTSDRLRITTEATAALGVAAKLAGSDIEGMSSVLEKMNKSLSDAAKNDSSAPAEALNKIGLSAKGLMQLSPDQALKEIADGLLRIPNANERAAASNEIFGKSSGKLANLLKSGSKAFEEAEQKAKLYGLSISRLDVAGVEASNDAISEMRMIWDGLFQQLSVKIAPALVLVKDKLVGWITEMGGVEAVADRVFVFMVNGAKWVANAVSYIELGWAGVKLAFKSVGAAFWLLVDEFTKGFTIIVDGIQDVARTVGQSKFAKKLGIEFEIPKRNETIAAITSFTKDARNAAIDGVEEAAIEVEKKWKDVFTNKNEKAVTTFMSEVKAKAKEIGEAVVSATDSAYTFGNVSEKALNKTANAAKAANVELTAVNSSLMSIDDIASKGGNSTNARYAREVLKIRKQAAEAEAAGRYDRAERLNARADKIEEKVQRRYLVNGEAGRPTAEFAALLQADRDRRARGEMTKQEEREAYRQIADPRTDKEREDALNARRAQDADLLKFQDRQRDWMKGINEREEKTQIPAVSEQRPMGQGWNMEGTLQSKFELLMNMLLGFQEKLAVA